VPFVSKTKSAICLGERESAIRFEDKIKKCHSFRRVKVPLVSKLVLEGEKNSHAVHAITKERKLGRRTLSG